MLDPQEPTGLVRPLAETEADLAERLGKEKLETLVALLEELSILLAQATSSSGIRK
jgi:hypothetical protein